MNKISIIILLYIFTLFQANTYAENYPHDDILTIDEPIPDAVNLEFSNVSKLLPKISEFTVLSSILMSNISGERWATVTIKNASQYQRLLDNEHIVAIFANGEKRNPIQAKHKFSGQEEITMVINFGKNKFPILRVVVRN